MATVFYSVRKDPFVLNGLYCPENEGAFRRVPADVAEKTSPSVASLAMQTAGARVRFSTDAAELTIKTDAAIHWMQNMCLIGSSGFDVYVIENGKEHQLATFGFPKSDLECQHEGRLVKPLLGRPGKFFDYVVYFPLYTHLSTLELGFPEEATVKAPTHQYAPLKPIVYYGSSITQGASASRPGLAYQAIISRRLNIDYLNLGFSGSAKAEKAIMEYMTTLDMSAFVCDYDHNAPNADYLSETHEPLYRAIREANPDLPIILVSAPDNHITSTGWIKRRAVIMQTYLNGLAAGDANLHLVDGFTMMMGDAHEEITVDGCHPNDLGFSRMAYCIGNTLSMVLRAKRRYD